MARKPRISVKDIETAAEWLEENEGLEGEAESCRVVAAWLRVEAKQRIGEAAFRAVSRASGLPMRTVRNSMIVRQRLGVDQ